MASRKTRKRMRAAIPADAREVIREYTPDGVRRLSEYFVGNKLVGRRYWHAETIVELEYGIRNETLHGPFYTWHENGVLMHQTRYVNGLEHGQSRQYDETGNLIGTYQMVRGTGIDLWYVGKGRLYEERHFRHGRRHGFERRWLNSRTVFEESSFKDGVEHGIMRRWNNSGSLRRGYPRYFVYGKRVSKKEYLQACAADKTLPLFIESENRPRRRRPIPTS